MRRTGKAGVRQTEPLRTPENLRSGITPVILSGCCSHRFPTLGNLRVYRKARALHGPFFSDSADEKRTSLLHPKAEETSAFSHHSGNTRT